MTMRSSTFGKLPLFAISLLAQRAMAQAIGGQEWLAFTYKKCNERNLRAPFLSSVRRASRRSSGLVRDHEVVRTAGRSDAERAGVTRWLMR